jgi:hypothetical protein
MATSQNGWTTNPPLDKTPFPGTKIVAVPGVRKGDVAVIFDYLGSQFNKRVEKLFNPGCWGYYNRAIIGSTVTSNHASGTAIDLNAPKHPLGASGTFTTKQRAEIRKILNYLDGVVRWGGDYSGRKDEMHFEIVGNSNQVKKVADKLKGVQVVSRKKLVADQRLYEFTQDTYAVSMPDNKKVGTILHKKGETINLANGDYTEYNNGKKFYRREKEVKNDKMVGYGKTKLRKVK